jgi:hypothetical protein
VQAAVTDKGTTGITMIDVILLTMMMMMLATTGYSNICTGLEWPLGFQEVEAPRFQDNRHMKEVMSSALDTGRFYPPPSQEIPLVIVSVRG